MNKFNRYKNLMVTIHSYHYIPYLEKPQRFDLSCFSFERIILFYCTQYFNVRSCFFRRLNTANLEREDIVMKKKLTGTLLLALLVALMSFAAVPVAAASFRYVPTKTTRLTAVTCMSRKTVYGRESARKQATEGLYRTVIPCIIRRG